MENLRLFIPGPVTVRDEVLAKMAAPQIGHRTKDASALQRRISDNLRKLWNTKEEILLSTTSGSGLMEGAIRSCTAKKAAVFSIGAFGTRWYEMGKWNAVEADLFETEMGRATDPDEVDRALASGKYDLVTITHNETSSGVMNPIEEIAAVVRKYPETVFCVDMVSSAGGYRVDVDRLGIDICITSSQKCLGLPAGLAACTFSRKAVERAKTVQNRGFYLDLLQLYDFIQKKDYQYPSTPSLAHMFALDYQLDYIINEEGLENRFARHEEMMEMVREWAGRNFALLAEDDIASRTVTTVVNTRNIDISELNRELKKRGMMISNGYGELKDKTFRIAHMADTTPAQITELLDNLDDILRLN